MRGRPLPLAIGVLGCALLLPAPLGAQEPTGSSQVESPAVSAETSAADVAPVEPAAEPAADGVLPDAAADAPAAPAPAPTRARRGAAVTVSMVDFAFQPATIQLPPGGGSVRWVNDGPQEPHTATAEDGGFDTGVLAVGESAVVDFRRPGRFAYVCELHPEMEGQVTVLAREQQGGGGGGGQATDEPAGPGGGGSAPTEAQAVAAPDAAGTSRSLPATGVPAGLLAGVGTGLVAAGLALAAGAAQPRRSGRCCER